MRNYVSPRIRELRAQVFYAGRDFRIRYALNLENLLPEISDRRTYPYSYIFFRITGLPSTGTDGHIPGETLQGDLSRLLDELTLLLKEPPNDHAGPVLGYSDISDRCRVSERTLRRWRCKGLPLRWFAFPDGRMGRGIRLSALARFVKMHRDLAASGARFSRITDDERRGIIDLAAQMRRCGDRNITHAAKEIALLFGRSPETVRHLLRRQDGPFAIHSSRITGMIARSIARSYETGASVPQLCRQYDKSRSAIYSAIRADKVARVLTRRLRFVHHPEFALAAVGRQILAGEPVPMTPIAAPEVGSDVDAYMAAVVCMPVLTPEQELRLFRRYNFLKYRMTRRQELLREKGYRAALVDSFERMASDAASTREQLIKCNLRLVASIARRHAGPLVTFADLMSTGTLVLMRAVDTFDFSRGNKFSTYLSWAMMKEFARRVPEENYRYVTFITGDERLLESSGGRIDEESLQGETLTHLKHLIGKALGALDALEQEVIKARFGLAGATGAGPMTLNEIGAGMGLTGERIRQIQNGALGKLKSQLGQDGLEALPG